ncbi:MAG: CDP-alcohol phosphatidyltransferase family protein [Phycisphaeraceae bacterium]|nr:CDP-alcohol phosphatidyltransferase family protein [Phycisphaeraceae bacterium]
MAATGVTPNSISITGMFVACGAGVCLALTGRENASERALFLLAALGIQVRLLANMLDGMVAIEGNRKSPTGDLYNEVPDRISDSVVLIGAGYALTSSPTLGYLAAAGALFVTYVRALGRSLGLPSDFRGPMAKQQRMFLATVGSVYLGFAPEAWRFVTPARGPVPELGVLALVLVLICVGEVATAWRRIASIASQLRSRAE